MTRKFKRTVKSVVFDGIITSEEKELLKKVASEENVSDRDAEIYITKELKKRKVKLGKGDNSIKKNSGAIVAGIITGIFSLAGTALNAFLKDGKK